jgi:hypothetical protein
VAGVSAQVPIVAKISAMPEAFEPNSRTMSVTTEWSKGSIALAATGAKPEFAGLADQTERAPF